MKRTAEKILAWLGNIILILFTLLLIIIKFTGSAATVVNDGSFKTALKTTLAQSGQTVTYTDEDINNIINIVIKVINIYTIVFIVLTVLAIIATLTMKKRIFSGVLFLLLSILILILTAGVGVVVSLPYFIVALMLFLRKGPKKEVYNLADENAEVEKIEYV